MEENRLKDHYTINELKADIEILKKRYNASQEEVKDLQNQNVEAQAKIESSNDIIHQLKDQMVINNIFFNKLQNDLKIEVKTKTDQGEMDKRKIQELKTKLREQENENTSLRHENEKLSSELRSKEKLESKLSFHKDEIKIIKDNK